MRRGLCVLLSLVLIVSLLAACGQQDTPATPAANAPAADAPAADAPTAADPPADSPVITVAMGWGPYETWFRNILHEAEAATGLTIEIFEITGGIADFVTEIASGGASGIDVWNLDGPQLPRRAADGNLVPITHMVDQADMGDFFDAAITAITYDGDIYAMPYIVHGLGLFYNKVMFAEAGLEAPRTMDDITQAAIALTDAENDIWGIGLAGGNVNSEPAGHILDWGVRFGGSDLLNAQGELVWGDQGTIDALQWHMDMIYTYQAAAPESPSWWAGDIANALLQGRVAMGLGWPFNYTDSLNPEVTAEHVLGNIGVVPGPVTNNVYAWVWSIMSTSNNPEAAFKFMEWGSSSDIVARLGSELLVPICRSSSVDIMMSGGLTPEEEAAVIGLTGVLEQGFTPFITPSWAPMRSDMVDGLNMILTTPGINIAAEVENMRESMLRIQAEEGT